MDARESVRIEVPGDNGAGSEFRLMIGAVPEWHQAKRQRAAGPWTVSAAGQRGRRPAVASEPHPRRAMRVRVHHGS